MLVGRATTYTTGSRSGTRPTRGYSIELAERSTSTAFFDPEPGVNEVGRVVRPRGVFEPDDPKDMYPVVEDFWEPIINSPRMDSDRLSPEWLRASDLNDVLQPDYMDEKRFRISPLQARHALAVREQDVRRGLGERAVGEQALLHKPRPERERDVELGIDGPRLADVHLARLRVDGRVVGLAERMQVAGFGGLAARSRGAKISGIIGSCFTTLVVNCLYVSCNFLT